MQAFYIMEYLLNTAFVILVVVALPSVVKAALPGVKDRRRKNST
jgi:hypothetical protein